MGLIQVQNELSTIIGGMLSTKGKVVKDASKLGRAFGQGKEQEPHCD